MRATPFNIVHGLPVDLLTLAHDGTKAYSETFESIHRREADGPNAIWQADHTPLDILLVRPDGETAKSVAHSCDRRLQPRCGGILSLVRRPVRPKHVAGITPGDLAQGRSALDCVRHPGRALH